MDVTGANEITITVTEESEYKITYETSTAVDIFNNTAGEIYVNSTGTYTKTDNVANYIVIPEGGSYNGYRPEMIAGSAVCIKTLTAGEVCVVRKGY